MSEQMSWLFFLFYAGLGKCQQWLLMAAPGWSPRSQWVASSTSPLLHSLHTLYSLFTSCQLPVSIWNAAVPPFSIQGLNKMQKLVVYPQTTPQLFLVHLVIRLGKSMCVYSISLYICVYNYKTVYDLQRLRYSSTALPSLTVRSK